MVEEVRRQEEGERHAKAVSITKQGRWTNWKGLEKKKLSWRDIWQMAAEFCPQSRVQPVTFP